MKKLILPFLFLAHIGFAQNINQLDINNVKAEIIPCADFIAPHTMNGFPYTVPKTLNAPSIYTASLWMGGFVTGQLRIGAMTYRQNGQDFWPGPVDTTSLTVTTTESANWDRTWKLNKTEIDSFLVNYIAGNVSNGSYIIPSSISTWPGNGNTGLNQAQKMAPFHDANFDGNYNPMQGDFPVIKGDQAVWSVFNDVLGPHYESGCFAQMGLEIRSMAYSYYCSSLPDSEQVLNNTTFYNFEIINRSNNIIDSFYIGVWIDADLGFYNDDYVGCNVLGNYGFMYAGDSVDQSSPGVPGYERDLPFLTCQILKGPKADLNDMTDNDHDGCVDCTYDLSSGNMIADEIQAENIGMSKFMTYANDGNVISGNPSNSGGGIQFYNYLRGKWRNGTTWRYDNLAGTSGTGMPCSYIFPGDSDPSGYGVGGNIQSPVSLPPWSETTAGNAPGDRRMLLSMGPFTFEPQSREDIEFALVFSRLNNNSGNFLDFTNMKRDNQLIKNWYQHNELVGCIPSYAGINIMDNNLTQVKIYPNPCSNILEVSGLSNVMEENNLVITDALGQVVFKSTIRNAENKIDISQLMNGVYLVNVCNKLNTTVFKLIKM